MKQISSGCEIGIHIARIFMFPPKINADVTRQRGEFVVGGRRYKEGDYDGKGVMVVASLWALLYALMSISPALNQNVDVLLASVF